MSAGVLHGTEITNKARLVGDEVAMSRLYIILASGINNGKKIPKQFKSIFGFAANAFQLYTNVLLICRIRADVTNIETKYSCCSAARLKIQIENFCLFVKM